MATFVLVHGAWHGAWCWQQVADVLEGDGHRVLAPDLPGHGGHGAPIAEMTLSSYAQAVATAIESADEPVVLVGHSMGGMVVTQAAEHVPDRIARLAYLTAFLPQSGQSIGDLMAAAPDADRLPRDALVTDERAGTCVLAEAARRDLLYNACDDEDAARAAARLVPESLAALGAAVSLSAGGAGRVPRAYIECLRDRTITIAVQRRMQALLPCDPVLQIDSDHSPFLSRPLALAEHLAALA